MDPDLDPLVRHISDDELEAWIERMIESGAEYPSDDGEDSDE